MSFKQLNPGLLTPMRGCEFLAFGFRFAATGGDDPDFLWQAGANAVASVARASSGTYTVTLNKPYPRALIACIPQLCQATASVGARAAMNYVLDSYDESAGTFTLEYRTDDGDATETIEDGVENEVVHVICVFQSANYNALTEDQS